MASVHAFAPLGDAVEIARALRTRSQIAAFERRPTVSRRFPEPVRLRPKTTVVAVVTHVATLSRTQDETAARLATTIDCLLENLGRARLEVVVNTIPERNATAQLPSYIRRRIVVNERNVADPFMLGFEAQEEFIQRAETADWFLYLEDDILLEDAIALEKLAYFNAAAPANALLLPHRYEYWQGERTYIDLVSKSSADIGTWNRLTVLEIEDWKFAEFENPHSGFHALSRTQLHRWLESGRHWRGKISLVAARESAATGCLAEAFRLYKPHPDNMTFFEVRHLDTKYSQEHRRRHGTTAEGTA
jgi:hypothetical protein